MYTSIHMYYRSTHKIVYTYMSIHSQTCYVATNEKYIIQTQTHKDSGTQQDITPYCLSHSRRHGIQKANEYMYYVFEKQSNVIHTSPVSHWKLLLPFPFPHVPTIAHTKCSQNYIWAIIHLISMRLTHTCIHAHSGFRVNRSQQTV